MVSLILRDKAARLLMARFTVIESIMRERFEFEIGCNVVLVPSSFLRQRLLISIVWENDTPILGRPQ